MFRGVGRQYGLSGFESGDILEQMHGRTGLSLLFSAGDRPCVEEVEHALAIAEETALAGISHRPHGVEGWLELHVTGLTFDLLGLAPGPGRKPPPAAHVYGLPVDVARFDFEAMWLMPGVHIAAGAALLPVVDAMTGMAAVLARHLPIKAVCWNPASSWMDAGYFVRIIDTWRDGGAFPVLRLVPLAPGHDGAIASNGLRHFTGQDVILESRPGEDPSQIVQLAGRIVDHLIGHGPLAGQQDLVGPEGETLRARVDAQSGIVRIARGD